MRIGSYAASSVMFALLICGLPMPAAAQQGPAALEVPDKFNLDMKTAARLRPELLAQSSAAGNRYATGQRVFERLVEQVHARRSVKPSWELRIVNDAQLNAFSSPDGTIYGCDHNDDYYKSMVGFGRIGLHTYITLNAGGGELKNPKAQVLGSMNNGGTPDGSIIVGLYVYPPDSSGQYRGYIVHNGRFHPYAIDGSTATQIWGINPAADFVGLYDDTNGHEHGFLQRWGSSAPVTIDVPSGPPFNATLTDAFAINPRGMIVGLYIDAAGIYHGYLAVRQRHNE